DVSISTWHQDLAAKAALPIGLTLLLSIGILVILFSLPDATEAPRPVLNRLMPAMSLMLIFLVAGAGTMMQMLYRTSLNDHLGALNDKTHEELRLALHYQTMGLAAAMQSLTTKPEVITAVSKKDSAELLACWQPVLKALSIDQKFFSSGFFDKNMLCIARSIETATAPPLINTSLAAEAKRTGKAASGLELTSEGNLILKIVSPIYDNNSLVGYFELGREIEDILNDLHSRSKMQIAISARKSLVNRQAWEARHRLDNPDKYWKRFPDSLMIFESQTLLPDKFTQTLEASGQQQDFVTSNILFEGKTWRTSGAPLKDASGQEIGTLFLINDITAATGNFNRMIVIGGVATTVLLAALLGFVFVLLRRTDAGIIARQAELCEKEERQAAILRSIGDGVIACDTDGRIESINLAAENLTGWSANEACGKPVDTVLSLCNSAGAPVKNLISLALEKKRVIEVSDNLFIKTKNGQQLQIAHSCAPVRNIDMAASGAVLVFRDITDMCRRNEELAEERKRIEYILGITRTGIDIIDPQFNLRYVDPAWQLTYGKPEGRKCYEYFMGLSGPCPGCGIPEALRTRKIMITEELLPKENRLVEVHTIPFQASEDQWLVAEFNVDITERRRLEEEGKKLQSQLSQAQKMESVGLLAGGVAHDFNNMLSVILGQAELAIEQLTETSGLREHLEEIQKAARRSADLTSQLLAFARKQTIAPKILDLNCTIDSMLKMLTRLIGENIKLVWKPATTPVVVCIDPSQVDQLLANLLVNARDAIGPQGGTVIIETASRSLKEHCGITNPDFLPGEYVILSVIDNGCGMSNETISHLFEPFFTTKPTGCGTGLGLATVYGIVKQNNGFIEVQSEPGKGSTFNIHIPGHTAETVAPETKPDSTAARAKNETILLVEDEPAILKISTMMLERMGYRVLTAETPEKAIQIAAERAGKIQLLMTDVIMPGMNGRELAEKVLASNPGLACLFMSGYTADVIADHGVLNAGVSFIQKPFSMNDLAEKVRKTLDSKG
ncbi:MAG: PAS domain-containing protein, partial [Candidatus Riflebacteria bacterium]|nr:PAS domain-containing protein [Candidatus Riflebacteria bacterium]